MYKGVYRVYKGCIRVYKGCIKGVCCTLMSHSTAVDFDLQDIAMVTNTSSGSHNDTDEMYFT